MGRAPCCDKDGLKRGPWSPEEDLKLINYIQAHGHGNWQTLPKNAGLQRCGKSCRLRWTNYLRPDIKRGRFSFEEEQTIIQLHSVLGNKWSAIAGRLPGRTDNEIKNYWNTRIRKRLLRNGIDPVTHAPRINPVDLPSMLTSSLSGRNLLNLSLSRQALLWNPGMLQLASLILSLRNENYNQFHQQHTFQEHNPFHGSQPQENQPEIPTSYQPGMAVSPVACPPLLSQNQQRQPSLGEFASDFVHPQQDGLEIPVPKTNGTLISEVNYIQQTADVSLANMNFLLEDEEQNLVVDTFVSTPLSDTTPSSSTPVFVNSSPEEEEDKDSYFSSFLDFDFSGHISTTNCCFD